MSVSALLAAALLAQGAPLAASAEDHADRVDVAYTELSEGRPEIAIARISANRDLERNDPAALINLGTAYARLGKVTKARAAYRAAIASPNRYALELADGRWMDSREAARIATRQLDRGTVLAVK